MGQADDPEEPMMMPPAILTDPEEYWIRANATRTFTSNTVAQAIFNSPANGALTLGIGVYVFEALLVFDTMSATSGNGKFGLGGSASIGQIIQSIMGQDVAADTVGGIGGVWTLSALQGSAQSATATTATTLMLVVRGTFAVTAAGTVIPQYTQANAAAMVVNIGSYFRCRRLGATGLISIGPWT